MADRPENVDVRTFDEPDETIQDDMGSAGQISRLHVLMADGTEAEGGPGAVMGIEPGHDAWTVGDERCVFIDFGESVQLADRS